ncbi:MAG: alkaline phosphatase family protein, partial [Acidobacteriota bacterium]|nr:alkaline phosphatase family protein [Acidobacteriota bacterium]
MRPFLFRAFAALCLASFVVACGGTDDVEKIGTRAVVIGIDGADWTLIEEIGAEGGMPNLMALRERGSWGPLETLNDIPLSPVIWTSIATGKTAAKHGISWFMVDRPDGTRVPVRSHNRKVKAIWNILAEAKRRPNIVGWWATYPAEDVGKGVIVSDGLGFHGFGSTARGGSDSAKTHPPSRFADFDGLVPALQQIPYSLVSRFVHLSEDLYRAEMFDPSRFPEPNPFNPIHLFQQYAATAQGYAAISETLLDENEFDLMMVYFEQVDSFSHLFMKYDPPKLEWVEEAPYERYKDIVREWYRYQDEILGRLLGHIDLETTAVFVVSDHGFKSGERRIRSEDTVDVKR